MPVLNPRLPRYILVGGLVLSVLIAPLLLTGVGAAESDDLAPTLSELVSADNPEEYAQENNLQYTNGSVLVVIELQANTSVPDNYQVEVEYTYSTEDKRLVQGNVSVSQLVELASEEQVEYIRPPTEGVTDTADQTNTAPPETTQEGDLENVESPEESSTSLDYFWVLAGIGIIAVVAISFIVWYRQPL